MAKFSTDVVFATLAALGTGTPLGCGGSAQPASPPVTATEVPRAAPASTTAAPAPSAAAPGSGDDEATAKRKEDPGSDGARGPEQAAPPPEREGGCGEHGCG